jgi:hypothetical protein
MVSSLCLASLWAVEFICTSPRCFHAAGYFLPPTPKGKTMAADVLIENHGSIAMFTPMTPDAHEWVEEHVHVEPWQWIGCSVACEPRCLGQLVEGMRGSGLVVE